MGRFFLLLFSLLMFTGCPPQRSIMAAPEKTVLQNIYKKVQGGQIDICILGEDSVYTATMNAYDAPTEIYSMHGDKVGSCNYAFNLVDSICYQLNFCKVIYRGRNHITGEKYIDLYHLED